MENERHTTETVDSVAPRLQRFVADLVERLRALNADVHTHTVYLLDSPQHPIEVICQVNDTLIRMNFTASLPGWAEEPRARLEVSFNLGKSKKFYEKVDKTFNLVKVVKTFIAEVHTGDMQFANSREQTRKEKLAAEAFYELAGALGIPPDPMNPGTLKLDNFRFRLLPGTPSKVAVVALVSHEQAMEMLARYRNRRAVPETKTRE